MVVTSPPYWGLRDYGTDKSLEIGSEKLHDCLGWARGVNCAEQDWTTGCHVCRMVLVFCEVRRVLRDDGTLWLNYGDSYNANTGAGFNGNKNRPAAARETVIKSRLKSGNLVGIPWRVALALQADGWMLRQDIIWHKPSPMPESVRNRCTKAHEYLFLLTKSMKYYYDTEAIKEKSKECWNSNGVFAVPGGKCEKQSLSNPRLFATRGLGTHHPDVVQSMSNKRSVWTVSSPGYDGAHFATFPPKLIEPCILAGTSEKGCCPNCGAPWKRIVESKQLKRNRLNDYVKRIPQKLRKYAQVKDGIGRSSMLLSTTNTCANSVAGVDIMTIGWKPTCDCQISEAVPCVCLDPFIGSGTTAEVCIDKGRWCWGIDLSEKYLRDNAVPRIEGALSVRPALARSIPNHRSVVVRLGKRLESSKQN